jgi:FdrA protein
MQISRALADLPGVTEVLVAMATELNLELLAGMGFPPPGAAGPNDMLIAVATADEEALAPALNRLDTELAGGTGGPRADAGSLGQATIAPRTLGSAIRAFGASLGLVSTPGQYAFLDAMDALDADTSVLLFSDNVPVEQEVALKRAADRRGLLVMGPDCGTAVIGGVGLGFANVVRPGPVGLVAASGTGAQQVMCLLGWAGTGISHCIGVGGRDLSAAVGGLSTHRALDALDADLATELIVVLGKPPAPEVAASVREHAARLGTPVVMAPLGVGQPDLTAAVEEVLRSMVRPVPEWPRWDPAGPVPVVRGSTGGAIRGLFSGGTLCQEAMVIASADLGPVRSNIPLPSPFGAPLGGGRAGHVMLDLGDDEYTVGRPHPMIDTGPRLERLAAEAADPECGVILLDVVLGHGAHPDPAADLAPVIRAALADRSGLTIVASLIGTVDDPQDVSRQAAALTAAGATVFASNAAATRHAVSVVKRADP